LFRTLLKNKIGSNSSIHKGLEIYCVGGISIGDNTTINKHVDLDGRGGLYIGSNVSISAYTKILTASHNPNSINFDYVTMSNYVEDYVWIGTGALILPGVKLGTGCVVAAGSVVTKSVEPYTIVAGNPARKINERIKELNYSPYWRPYFQ
jgi:maltose O-acetyltransferase